MRVRSLLLLTVLGVLTGTLRMDQIHAHAHDGAGHAHPEQLLGGHTHASHDDGVEFALHAHDSITPLFADLSADGISTDTLPPVRWQSAVDQSAPPLSETGPPHRPPIA